MAAAGVRLGTCIFPRIPCAKIVSSTAYISQPMKFTIFVQLIPAVRTMKIICAPFANLAIPNPAPFSLGRGYSNLYNLNPGHRARVTHEKTAISKISIKPANADVCGLFILPDRAWFDCFSNKCLFSNIVQAVSAENLGGLVL